MACQWCLASRWFGFMPHNRGTTTVPLSCLFREKTSTHFTPVKWWFVLDCHMPTMSGIDVSRAIVRAGMLPQTFRRKKDKKNKPPHNRGTVAIPLFLYLFHEKDTTHFTPFKWWFVEEEEEKYITECLVGSFTLFMLRVNSQDHRVDQQHNSLSLRHTRLVLNVFKPDF